MGNITWTKSWSAADNGTVLGGADIQSIQGDITTVVNGGITNSNVNASAAIAESKLAFDTTVGHDHDGTDSKSIASAADMVLRGLEVADTADDDAIVTIRPGKALHGTSSVAKTADTVLTFATADNWYDTAAHSYIGGAGWCYIGYDSDGDIRLLHTNAPDVDDIDGNDVTGATKLYFDDSAGTSEEYWRVIGAVYVDIDNKIHASYGQIQSSDMIMYNIPVSITTTVSAGAWSGATTVLIPAISTMVLLGGYSAQAGSNAGVSFRPNGTTWTETSENAIYGNINIGGQRWCATDSAQRIQYYNNGGDTSTAIDVEGYKLNIR